MSDEYRRLIEARPQPDCPPIPIGRIGQVVSDMGLAMPSYKTCVRWARYGHAGIKLATASDGRRTYTTMAAIRAFVKEAGIR